MRHEFAGVAQILGMIHSRGFLVASPPPPVFPCSITPLAAFSR